MARFHILESFTLRILIMSRRESKEDRKQQRQQRKDNRKQNITNELQRIILACEGSVTEKNYFQAIFDDLIQIKGIAKTSFVIAKHKHTDPKGVLQDLLTALKKDSEFEHKWIVIDRDEMRPNGGGHELENFNGAISSAEAQNINIAYSNPSFEIWYLLHFEYRSAPLDRDEVIKNLNKHVDYAKNSQTIYEEILHRQEEAIANAQRLTDNYIASGGILKPANSNPSTTAHQLVKLLHKFKKKQEN